MTSTGSSHPGPDTPVGPFAERADQIDASARTQGLDNIVQLVFAAGLSLSVTADMSNQPEVVSRLEQIGSDLDAIVRHVWRLNLCGDVPLGPSDPTIELPA